ncbi:MAG: hypothetical protein H0X24_14455 [Ktedonobacterales bacterium]|nr:hypothetical protein [Ktedonobacterales bacterium]
MTRKWYRGLLLLLIVLGVRPLMTPALAASGDAGDVFTTAALLTCSDTRCSATATVPAGTWVPTWCWRDGGSYNGTPRWFRIHYGGQDGWVSASQMSSQPTVPYCNNLAVGEALFAGQALWSPNGAYSLAMQNDGNLVIYSPSGALWASNTSASPAPVARKGSFHEAPWVRGV